MADIETGGMVERVARAMAAEIGFDWNEMSDDGYAPYDVSKKFYLRIARAAIEAMREPTEKMIHAGYFADETDFSGETSISTIWDAMIDAVLTGP